MLLSEQENSSFKGGDTIHKFRAVITNVVDGDTIDADCFSHFLDLDFKVNNIRFRLLDIDTPELRGDEVEAGIEAKLYLERLILGKKVYMESHEKDSFGRYLAYVFLKETEDVFINVNELLIREGYAKPYED